ncbi:MAG: bifunctional DNA primase/polymerase [Mycobacterium sp.]
MTLRNPDTTYDKDILGAARTYANACIPVFPLKPGWKSPLFPTAHPEGRGTCRGECGKVGHGFHDATLDHDIIRDWWTQTPGANIGVRPWSHIGVVDIDVAEGKRGRETFHQLWRELGPLSDSGWIVETPTGGRHYWLDLSEGDPTDWLDTTEHHYHARGGLGPGVDIKIGRTGYVAAPPSTRPEGPYRWLHPCRGPLPDGMPPKAPPAWRERILKPKPAPHKPIELPAAAGHNPAYVKAAIDRELDKLANAIPGNSEEGRRPTLFKVACALFGFAKGGHADAQALRNILLDMMSPHGFNTKDIERQLDNAWALATPREIPRRTTDYFGNTTF